MPNNTNGKPGTIKPEEFDQLKAMVRQYGGKTLAAKVSKVCSRLAAGYKHEYPNSAIAAAWTNLSGRISTAVGTVNRPISNDSFKFLAGLVNTYGPELIVQKLGKIEAKNGNTVEGNSLKTLFPSAPTRAA